MVTQIASLTTKNIAGGKGNGCRYVYIDYSLPPLALRMFLPNLLFFLKMKIHRDTVFVISPFIDQQYMSPPN